MVKWSPIRADPDFNRIVKELAVKNNLSVRTVTTVLAGRLKGMNVVEVIDKNGKVKKLTMKRLASLDVTEIFDDIQV